MVESSKTKKSMARGLCPVGDCFHGATDAAEHGKAVGKKPGGWKAMPYILGNETFERLATFGLLANFMVYLMRVYHMEQVEASNVLNIWMGITNFAPLIGAFISDAKYGRFRTIAVASFASFLGMVMLTLTAWVPTLHPPSCSTDQMLHGKCQGPNAPQVAFIAVALGFLSIGAGGIRPCSIPFGVDQFDPTTEEGQKGINSFYNWYYTSFTVVILITQTVVVYIQDSVSWVWGFGIPTFLMLCSITLFFFGTRIYVHVKPEGSVFLSIIQVFVAAYRKRKVKLPPPKEDKAAGVFYDPQMTKEQSGLVTKLARTDKFRFLNKAAMVLEGDLDRDGSPTNKWRLSSIQQVEEVKCLLKIGPVWASGIISFTSMLQQGTFTISQSMTMDRHLGSHFQIPPGSFSVISFLTIGLWVPFYDRVMVPALRKVTHIEGGITQLQRIGVGIVISVLAMVVAGKVERDRRESAIAHPGGPLMSAMWLAPQLVLMGLSEAFNIIGQIEFYNTEFPYQMRSIANSLFFCSFAGASYICTLMVNIVHSVTGGHGRPDWLTNNLNEGRLDYFYFLLAVMGALNFGYYLYSAIRYRYKAAVALTHETGSGFELTNSAKV